MENAHPEDDEHDGSNARPASEEVHVGDLGSGSDFTPFLQHAGVPSTDIGSSGPYGVYHSAFDDFAWYTQNADPHFLYLQEMARVFGLEALRMAEADVLPYDYVTYASEISSYIAAAKRRASDAGSTRSTLLPPRPPPPASCRGREGARPRDRPSGDLAKLNFDLRQTETDLLDPAGLPNRPWYKHTIYAPGEFTGYEAVVIPGVNEAIDAKDASRAAQQLTVSPRLWSAPPTPWTQRPDLLRPSVSSRPQPLGATLRTARFFLFFGRGKFFSRKCFFLVLKVRYDPSGAALPGRALPRGG